VCACTWKRERQKVCVGDVCVYTRENIHDVCVYESCLTVFEPWWIWTCRVTYTHKRKLKNNKVTQHTTHSVLQCVAVCCSVLQCVAVPRHPHLTKRRHNIQRTATHCNMNESCHTDTQEDLKGNKVICYHCGLAFCKEVTNYQVLQTVSVYCSLLQSVAVCCCVLHSCAVFLIRYGVATLSRIDKMIGLFCKRDL